MSRHLADHRKPATAERAKRFLDVERANKPEGSHPSIKALSRRPAQRADESSRTKEFLRIDRGREA